MARDGVNYAVLINNSETRTPGLFAQRKVFVRFVRKNSTDELWDVWYKITTCKLRAGVPRLNSPSESPIGCPGPVSARTARGFENYEI